MNILLIGGGGREHALAWAVRRSPLCGRLYCAPGNGGISELADCVSLDVTDHDAVAAFCKDHEIGLVIVGPEAPLVAGLVDDLAAQNIKAFGPSAAAARLEGSKGFTKDLCARHAIPTARYGRFTDADKACAYAATLPLPVVIKADGLAAGKGVVIAETRAEADAAIADILDGQFGSAGAELVVEEFLHGEEASLFALVDGETAVAMAGAQDHKRIGDGDTGPNTGGMGAYSPAPILDAAMEARVMDEIVRPTVAAMKAEGYPYKGVLYAGLMIAKDGPKLIEYNARFGDPECQVLMMRLESDIVPALLATIDGTLSDIALQWRKDVALTVVMAAKGYPGGYEKGETVGGLEAAGAIDGVQIFHAGTIRDEEGRIKSNGGRVLNVTAMAPTVAEAQARAYAAIDKINWPGGTCRRDIGWRAIAREKQGKE